MPLGAPGDFGTAANGLTVNNYCRFCFQGGSFTEPAITKQAMIERCADIMAQQGIMAKTEAETLMTEVIPNLERWR
jgi:hypothetical protein